MILRGIVWATVKMRHRYSSLFRPVEDAPVTVATISQSVVRSFLGTGFCSPGIHEYRSPWYS